MLAKELVEKFIKASQKERVLTLKMIRSGIGHSKGDIIRFIAVPFRKSFVVIYCDNHSIPEGGDVWDDSGFQYSGFIYLKNKRWYDYQAYLLYNLCEDEGQDILGLCRKELEDECVNLYRKKAVDRALADGLPCHQPINVFDYLENPDQYTDSILRDLDIFQKKEGENA